MASLYAGGSFTTAGEARGQPYRQVGWRNIVVERPGQWGGRQRLWQCQ